MSSHKSPKPPIGFFACASLPYSIPATIKAAIEAINKGQQAELVSWELLNVGGKYIVQDRIEPALEDAYISLVMPAPPSKLPTSGELWRRRGDEPSATITASIPFVILPCCIGIDSSNF